MNTFNYSVKSSVGTILMIASLVFLAGCGAKPPATQKTQNNGQGQQPVIAVELVSPVNQHWLEQLAASGNVQAWQEASIGVEVSGVKLDSVLVNVGDQVHKGELLAQFNEDSLRTDLAQQDALVAEAAASLAKADSEYKRAKLLDATGSISQQDIVQYQTTYATAAATLASAKAQRDAQLLKIRYARVVAPDDGVISSRTATLGAVGSSGSELFRLIRNNRLEWRAEVSAENLSRVMPGKPVRVLRPDGTSVTGTLRQLAPSIDTSTRYGLVYVDLPAHSGLTAGMYAKGYFPTSAKAALVLPESAIMFRDGSNYVMKIDNLQRAHQVKVSTGRRQDQQIEIITGVNPGDQVILSGASFVSDGDLVTVVRTSKSQDNAVSTLSMPVDGAK